MKRDNRSRRIGTRLSMISLPMFVVMGCASTMNTDESGQMMSTGLSEARSGLGKAQTGLDEFNGGKHPSGMTDMSAGMDQIGQGMSSMTRALGMMSNAMMMRCTDGGSSMMEPMQSAFDEMNQGKGMLADDQAGNDAEGASHMTNGMTVMTASLDGADGAMNCMGHNNMMSGSMH